ncbi:MAG: sulfotransferase [Proteobacteria bacterium]|nr:sulfotransferase [Pseudomonadota bacterium]
MTDLPLAAPRASLPRKLDADLTVTRMVHGRLEALVNSILTLLEKGGFKATIPDMDGVLAEALRKTKPLTNFGDEHFMAALRQLMTSLDRAEWTVIGRFLVRGLARRALQHRLQIESWFEANPAALDIKIERPIFVLGFPRTGTTLLQNLLSLPDHRRSLLFWELTNPVPIHPDYATDRKKRSRQIKIDLFGAYQVVPELPKLHYVTPDSPEECWSLFANSLSVLNFDLSHGLHDFGDWLLEQDMEWAYREYERQLKMLLWREPANRLVLKCPEHLWFIDSLLKVFPDACIVMTHREPTDCIASYCSMVSLNRRTMEGCIDPKPLGRHITKRFRQGTERAMAARAAHGNEDQFLDVDFYDLVADPAAMVHKIEDHFGLKTTDQARLDDYLNTKRHDNRGAHKYSAELYGLEPAKVHEEFAPYIDRFGVRLKAPAKKPA